MITDTDIVLIITILSGAITMMVKMCFKSKCDKVELCCGFLKIHREISEEKQDNESTVNSPINSPIHNV
jgi:hypothetical protein